MFKLFESKDEIFFLFFFVFWLSSKKRSLAAKLKAVKVLS